VQPAHRAIDKASSRLRGLSKYARKPTRERLLARLVTRHLFVEEEIDRLASRIWWCCKAAALLGAIGLSSGLHTHGSII
jgi:hypothetical protein